MNIWKHDSIHQERINAQKVIAKIGTMVPLIPNRVKSMATIVYLIQTIIYVGMVVYAPSLALETVTGLGKWASVWLTGTICIFYTSIGGLKAVVWTDTIQLFIMMSGFLGIIIKGSDLYT